MNSLRVALAFAALLVCGASPASAAGRYDIWGMVPALMADAGPEVRPEAPPSYPDAASHRWYVVASALRDGFPVRDETFGATLGNGQTVYVVSIDSGGSGGVFVALLWTKIGSKTRFVGYVPSSNGHLDAGFAGGQLVFKTPIYGPSDPNCCQVNKFHVCVSDGTKSAGGLTCL